ncbi:MAG: hypothetical protein A3D59_03580 [Candidatus Wildermuthbacteria bacterium RIFCSPHIGHO2_02_FULL_47_17]|uniref:Phospholipid/glycerol acyltransferase domain-containing protein n=1 Tax=Candidatus Wildermuthbacteria bacterium RIFCSPHIGHO2_02_FULL_47_17 TaxID=1802452 RepID=A0A1G2R5U5_9BACT|nr:MAG: hypothetical protein A3D59_03580 [Candidatus Wildermuthbacteria bacterium RIFCSPHIGHO2_02_FULL_47_17]
MILGWGSAVYSRELFILRAPFYASLHNKIFLVESFTPHARTLKFYLPEKERPMKRNVRFVAATVYSAGLLLAVFIAILIAARRLKVVGRENIPLQSPGGVLLLSNHPSLIEPILLQFLLGAALFKNPSRYFPWTAADRGNFYDPWYCWWLRRLRLVPISRSRNAGLSDSLALRSMANLLKGGAYLLIFPEGTRTYKAVRRSEYYGMSNGKKMGILRGGMGMLALLASPLCVPIWVEGTDKILPPDKRIPRLWRFLTCPITIRVGSVFVVDGARDHKKAAQVITEKLLELAESAESAPKGGDSQ